MLHFGRIEAPPTSPLIGALLQTFPRAAVIVGPDARVLAVNTLASDVLPGLRIGDPLVRTLRDPIVHDAMRRVEQTGARETVTMRERVPIERVFDVTVAAMDADGHPRMVTLTFDDLTEARRIERMRADFIANASHELRTPLASLLGFVETLQGPARDDPTARARFLDIMAEQARRMARLIDDLLSLSRIEQKRHIRPGAPVDFSAVVRHVADTLCPLASDNKVRLALRVDDGITVPGDRDELVRVAENLIENGIKYGITPAKCADEPQSVLDIGLSVKNKHAMFSVRDYGDGIAPEHLPRLTERFYRIDAGHSRAKGGTGLGLALVKHVVAHHRGRLEVESTPGQGSTFSVQIPIWEFAASPNTDPLVRG